MNAAINGPGTHWRCHDPFRPFLALCLALTATAQLAHGETHRYIPTPEELKYTFATGEPVLRVKPGDTIETWTENALGPAIQRPGDQIPPDERPNPNTGPFFIEGAQPGDTLAVRLISIEPAAEYAAGIAGPGFGALTQTPYTPMLDQPIPERIWYYRIDKQARTVEFSATDSSYTVQLPLGPFLGCLGVAPAGDEARSTVVPEFFGGNMDTPEVRAGSTIYFPVNVAGAFLYLGDGHAAQGEGEIAGTAAEVAMDVTFEVDVIKGRVITTPRLEDDTHLMVAGSYRPLEDAMRIASRELIQWMVDDYGLSPLDAYELLSVAMESNVSQLVDPNYTVVVKIKKAYLPPKKR